jgi:predicted PurR-regulated permease PerM/ActR/RegA family two-component response regulator
MSEPPSVSPAERAASVFAGVRPVLRILLTVLATAAVIALAWALRAIVLLVVLSVFFAYLVAPLVERLHAWRLPRAAAILIVYALLCGGAGAALYTLVPRLGDQVAALAKAAPSPAELQHEREQHLERWYRRAHVPPPVRAAVDGAIDHVGAALARHAEELSGDVLAGLRYLPWLVLIPVVAFFLLKDAASFRRSALLALPPGRVRWRGADFLAEINSTLAYFIRAQLLAALFVGVVCTIGFVALGVPYALVLGGAATLFELFPFVGPVTMMLAAVGFASTRSGALALAVFCFLAGLRVAQDYIVYPRLIARGIQLHPLAIILAVLCGSTLGGFLGLFLAVPVTAILAIAYRYLRLHLGSPGLVSELVGRESPPTPPAVTTTGPREPVGQLDGVKVLVVDNDPDARDLLVSVLMRAGSQAWGAGSAAEAMTLLRSVQPHLLISDLAMPDEDGFDLIRRLRSDGVVTLPAVALSGYASEEDRTRALQAGFALHLQKPVDPAHLAGVVGSLTKGAHARL